MKHTYNKYLVTHEACGTKYTNAYIIPNHYSKSFNTFAKLVEELRKTFKGAKSADIECHTVTHSSWCKGSPIIRFLVTKKAVFDKCGWIECDKMPDIQYS